MESRPSWWDRANCAGTGPDLWFPEMLEDGGTQRGSTGLYSDAKQVCAGCEVKDDCLEFGMDEIHFGLFGGKSPKERRLLKAERLRQSSNLASA